MGVNTDQARHERLAGVNLLARLVQPPQHVAGRRGKRRVLVIRFEQVVLNGHLAAQHPADIGRGGFLDHDMVVGRHAVFRQRKGFQAMGGKGKGVGLGHWGVLRAASL